MDIEWIQGRADCVDRRGNIYRVITKAKDVQTGETMVVYIQTFGDKMVLCCPLDAFCVSFKPANETIQETVVEPEKPQTAHERMIAFFDTGDFSEKAKLLREMHVLGQLNDGIIDNLAAALDVVVEDGDIDTRYEQLKVCVETRARYESGRLR